MCLTFSSLVCAVQMEKAHTFFLLKNIYISTEDNKKNLHSALWIYRLYNDSLL